MFGLFKSKEDREIDNLVSMLRETKEEIFFDGNIVIDLSGKILKRYKLTMSIIENIHESGILTPNTDSGYVVLAIGKREALHIHYNSSQGATKIALGSSTERMLERIKDALKTCSEEAIAGHGVTWHDLHFTNLVGAVTVLGYEVGVSEYEYEVRLPFYYKGHKFYIAEYDNKSWIVFEE